MKEREREKWYNLVIYLYKLTFYKIYSRTVIIMYRYSKLAQIHNNIIIVINSRERAYERQH
jgi:hypothetical protein